MRTFALVVHLCAPRMPQESQGLDLLLHLSIMPPEGSLLSQTTVAAVLTGEEGPNVSL